MKHPNRKAEKKLNQLCKNNFASCFRYWNIVKRPNPMIQMTMDNLVDALIEINRKQISND